MQIANKWNKKLSKNCRQISNRLIYLTKLLFKFGLAFEFGC